MKEHMLASLACLGFLALLLIECNGAQLAARATPAHPPSTPNLHSEVVDADYYRFKLGDFECVCLYDGIYDYSLRMSFPSVPVERVQDILRQNNLPIDYVRSPYTYLYVNTGEHQVLVDMGAGSLTSTTGKLPQSLHAAGIDPAQIDTVIITHAHPDHVGGTLDEQGELIYDNAKYYISKAEWNFWFSEQVIEVTFPTFVRFARKYLEAIQERVVFVEGETEIMPGIYVIPAPGHTPGHMVVHVVSGDEQLLYASDSASHPLHLEYYPDLVGLYDIIPEERVANRHKIFNWAAEEKILVIGQQFPPFPGLGYVIKQGAGWKWQPVE